MRGKRVSRPTLERKQQKNDGKEELALTHQNFPKMRSITQFTGVALTDVQVHTPKPCKSWMTALMMGSCTNEGLGTSISVAPSLVMSLMGS